MNKERLDVLMTEHGLADSRSLSQRLIMAGQVRVNGQVVLKPAEKIALDAQIVIDRGPKYVSRGGEKLEAALIAFNLNELSGRVCADVGASTGGFTDCLLQAGAAKVYAIDVGYGILHWKLRSDPRVIVMERTNARYVTTLPEIIDLVVVDASFISLKILLPTINGWSKEGEGEIITLIKPQFEAGREDAAKGEGVIRDPAVHRKVLEEVVNFASEQNYEVCGLIRSPLTGPKGNIEFLMHLKKPKINDISINEFISCAMTSLEQDPVESIQKGEE